ncbi:DUF2249 domain-containing protein [Rhizobium leguminosarum]|uniref:DUF2249 domain-containing protein n=1 Tax=Rhizobium leguminosarum TaxID=384 RepID=UPI00144111F2|nr:DUF2249 domain-containing protein [Rhizobium leguminosarum]MBY5838551.1 DUF2249 domain-containing protein [Rhizobium leguminosarum]NKM76683.1 DUF2249 domain-containing protein [Rhizobium leguminosarum bv. viciae]QSZ07572.1 DUF2249 domain-containing protein [Rhizobium leguminosarum]
MSEAQTQASEVSHIDVRTLHPGERHPKIFGTLHTLMPGGVLHITSDHEPRPLQYQLETALAGKFSWEYLEQGPEVWRVEITRLDVGCDCCCGSH